ncbi:ATP-dependent helicase [uncultured Agrococcus sp.]|uniref:ATP-dependent helicase n=1 Tax=uncultured Agrococcus sp. TaxID=382258 RepID=UPI0025D268B5|nr:ATP-dependent helicase [uncultured Agrococcus sp.]
MTVHPESLLDALDDGQREAAEALHGPVCILAGAGTGKTRAITHRIAYGVATGAYDPARVMALTFTTKAAGEMRSRLAALGAGAVQTRTFHSAALSQLSYFWPRTLGTRTPELVRAKVPLVADAAAQLGERLDTATLRDLAGEIEWRKSRSMTMEQYAANFEERALVARLGIDRVVDLHGAYERIKDDRRQMDFEDVLLATAGMIAREPDVAQWVREQYRHFTVDEYQDASPAQTNLLELWLGRRADVCVVGDPHQTIYSFAGADRASLSRFQSDHPGTRIVQLVRNYRSQARVIEIANALVHDPERAPLEATHGAGESVRIEEAETDAAEGARIAERIRELLASGVEPADIAVLVRFHAQGAPIVQAVRAEGIGIVTEGSSAFFELQVVRKLILAFRAAPVDDRPLFQQVVDLARDAGWSSTPPAGRGEEREQWDAVQAIVNMAEEAGGGTTLSAFAASLTQMAEAEQQPRVDAVTLATLHAAKGLEWEHVIIAGLSEGILPISYATTEAAIEEEGRLFYVGVTRARTSLAFTRSVSSGGAPRKASRFLVPLQDALKRAPSRAARR